MPRFNFIQRCSRRFCSIFYLSFAIANFSLYAIANEPQKLFLTQDSPELGQIKGFKGSELCVVASNTQQYIEQHGDDLFAVHAGKVFDENITLARVQKTLKFICDTYRDDVRSGRQSRLHDSDFLKQNFDFIRWNPDKKTANSIAKKSTNKTKTRMLESIPEEQIFLTKYYTKLLDGSEKKTEKYSQALYALPYDEQDLTLEQANAKKHDLTRFKYTRQEVMQGVLLEQAKAKPLVWITPEALHDVILQGTGVLKVDGQTRYFNVHRNNGIAYDYSIGKREQARYWYFAEVPSILGYGEKLNEKIAIRPHVSFAGNVAELGLGKLIMVNYKIDNHSVSRVGVLADQGGAFDNNLFQLDMLVDSYKGWSDYHQSNKHLPDYANAWIMVLKLSH